MLKHGADTIPIITLEPRRLYSSIRSGQSDIPRAQWAALHWYFSNQARKQKIACAVVTTIMRYYDMTSPVARYILQYSLRYREVKASSKSLGREKKTNIRREDEVFILTDFQLAELQLWRRGGLFGLFLISIVIACALAGNWLANFEFGLSADDGSAFCTRRWWYLADVSTAPFSDETTCRWLSIKRMHTPPRRRSFLSATPVLVLLFFSLWMFFFVFFFILNARHLA